MNSLGRKSENNVEKQSIFTRETFGVVLILFATLCLVCLITRENVFSAPGQYVNAFLFGCFGYFAYPITVFCGAFGVYLITGKKIEIKAKLKLLISIVCVCVAIIWQVVKLSGKGFTFNQYLYDCYHLAEGGIKTCTPGGFFTAVLAYPVCSLLTEIGTYVVLGAISCLCLYFIIKTVKDNNTQIKPEQTQVNSSYAGQKDSNINVEISGEKDYPVDFVAQPPKSTNQKLFVSNPTDFAFKTKKEISRQPNEGLKIEFSQKGLGVINYSGTYSQQYSDEMQRKIAYVKTPAVIDVNSTIKPSVKDYILKKTEDAEQTPVVSQSIDRIDQNDVGALKEDGFFKQDKVSEAEVSRVIEQNNGQEQPTEQTKDDATLHADNFNKYAEVEEVDGVENLKNTTASEPEEIFHAIKESDLTKVDETYVDIDKYIQENQTFIDEQAEQNGIDEVEDNVDIQEEQGQNVYEEKYDEPDEVKQSSIINDRKINDIFSRSNESEPVSNDKKEYTPRPMGFGNGFASSKKETGNIFDQSAGFTAQEPEEQKPPKEIPPINREYFRPPLSLLENYKPPVNTPQENHAERMAIIKQVFHDFNVEVEPRSYVQGPSITRYEVKMPAGFSVKKTVNFDDDLKTYLRTRYGVIIEAPIPGKDLVGIEVANESKVTVGLKSLLESQIGQEYKPDSLMFAIGKDIVGKPIFDNLAKGPHFLVAGATGSGKSVCLNIMIVSLIMRYSPEELRLILVDPKGVEFGIYEHIPHLMIDEIITEPKKALATLQWAINEMERRFKMLQECGSVIRDIESYNKEIANDKIPKMPRIVIVVDELSNLMETCKREMEAKILSLAQKARSVGIHLVLATQRPSVDVITGVIKANLPSRIALKVMNFADSNTIIGAAGAEKLLGNGDMLYQNSGMSEFERYQGAYISGKEVDNVVSYIKKHNKAYFDDDLKEFLDNAVKPPEEEIEEPSDNANAGGGEINDFFLKCLWEGVNSGSISISMLQRRFQIGYAKAGGIVDKMERMGFVSSNEGAKARRILITREQFIERFGPVAE